MKSNMKKVIAFLCASGLMLLAAPAFAQLSVGAGYFNGNLGGKLNGEKLPDEAANGIYAGACYNVPLHFAELSIVPGAYLSFASSSASEGVSNLGIPRSGDTRFTEMAVNVPLMLMHSHAYSGDAKAFIFLGPTFQYGLSSKTKTGSGTIDHYASGQIDKFSLFVGGGVGAVFAEKLRITVGYDYGLTDIYPADAKYLRRVMIRIGVGYVF